jgi:outer membrane lipoprotein-sorting protein
MTSAKGRFVQTDPNGATSQGTFYLQRPGKVRFEYDPRRPMLVVSDGSNVKIYDRALKTFDQYPLGATPLSLFLAREVRLDRGVVIDRVEAPAGGFAITARDGRKQAEGRIELVFSGANRSSAASGTVIDPRGQRTRVRLNGLTQVASLDPKLFVLRDPTRRSGRP